MDPGDEHVDAPPPPRDEFLELLARFEAEGNPIHEVDADLFYFMMMAESMRDCCEHCALEANGEDGA